MSSRALFLLPLLLAGCAAQKPMSATDRQAAAACRAQTDASFNRQNRYLLSERSTTDSPFSTSGVTGITTRGLSQRYDYDNQLASCLSGAGQDGAGVVTTPPPPTGFPTAPY